MRIEVKKQLYIHWVIGLCVLLASCASSQQHTFATVTHSQLIGPDDVVSGAAWVDNWIIVTVDALGSEAGFATTLWRFRPDGSGLEQLALPSLAPPTCAADSPYGFGSPQRLPDGRLGYMFRCNNATGPNLHAFLMAADLTTGAVEHLRSEPLLTPRGMYAWNPPMTRGIAETGTHLVEEQLYWFTPTTSIPYETGFPQAAQPDWSPDGEHIAFVAADEQGLQGIAQLDAEFAVYVARSDGIEIRALVTGLHYPSGMAWSPDGRWLVVSGRFARDEGLWLIDSTTGGRQQLTTEHYTSPSWAPDGQSVFALAQLNPDEPMSDKRIIRLDLSWETSAP